MLKNNSAGRLLFWKHAIFHRFANSKLQRGFRGNLDGFAGRGVSAFTGLSIGFHEFSDAWDNELTV